MDEKELARLEQVYQDLLAELDYSTIDGWYKSLERCAEVFESGDIYPAMRAARVLARSIPFKEKTPDGETRVFSVPSTVRVFRKGVEIKYCATMHAPGQMLCQFCHPDAPLEGQELLIYQAHLETLAAETAERKKKREERQQFVRTTDENWKRGTNSA